MCEGKCMPTSSQALEILYLVCVCCVPQVKDLGVKAARPYLETLGLDTSRVRQVRA